uniref:Zinc finger CCCH domain-containing protein 5 n=1 Tax=Noccaea caerulescens TaxID=107243 RepID=A0A1J3F6B8_NOCCA
MRRKRSKSMWKGKLYRRGGCMLLRRIFSEDVHTEFLKYGKLINFKVCQFFSAPSLPSPLPFPISAFMIY